MTLVEIAIASAILILVFYMTMDILFMSSRAATDGSIASTLESRGRQFTDFCKIQFQTARFVLINVPPYNSFSGISASYGSYGNQIIYEVPVDRDTTGYLRFGYTSNMGKPDPAGTGKFCLIRFEPTEALRESDSALMGYAPYPYTMPGYVTPPIPYRGMTASDNRVYNRDLNADGDLWDTIVRGRMVKYILRPDGTVETSEDLSDNICQIVSYSWGSPPNAYSYYGWDWSGGSPSYSGGLDGNPYTPWYDEIIFAWRRKDGQIVYWGGLPPDDADSLTVSVWHGNFSQDQKKFILRRSTETIKFRK